MRSLAAEADAWSLAAVRPLRFRPKKSLPRCDLLKGRVEWGMNYVHVIMKDFILFFKKFSDRITEVDLIH